MRHTFAMRFAVVALATVTASVVLVCPEIFAQAASARVSGKVVDDTGGVLPGVTVTITNAATNQSHSVVSTEQGLFRFANLTPGRYTLTAALPGFATYRQGEFSVNVGGSVDLDIVMQLSSVEETVTVTGEAPLVEKTKTEMSTVIGIREIETLPTSSRDYLEFALLTPGTVENQSTTSQGIGINIGGARAKEASLLVDGFWNTDESFTFPRLKYSQDSIAEFQVISMGAEAEFGRAIGGIINAVTKSGGNQLSGSGYGYFRDKGLNAQDPLARQRGAEKAEFERQLYGASFGGPILQDRTFFFGSFERLQQHTPQDNNITAENAAIIGIPSEDVGSIPRDLLDTFAMGKVTHQINENHSLQGSYVYTRDTNSNLGVSFRTRATRSRLRSVDTAYQFQWTGVARGGNWLHQLRASFFPRDYQLDQPNEGGPPLVTDGQLRDSLAPTVDITNVARFGGGRFTLAMDTRPWHITYNSTIFKDAHNFKFGVDGMFVDFDYIRNPGPQTGFYRFRTLDHYLRGEWSTYSQQFGDALVERYHTYMAAFIQDTWTAGDRLTLNYGIRYDLEFLSKFRGQNFGEDYNNFGPRFGLSYDLTGQGRTIAKVGTGIYFDRIFQNPITPTFFDNKEAGLQVGATWTPNTPGAPTFPNTFPNELPADAPLNVRDVYIVPEPGNMEVPRSFQLVTSVDHAFNDSFASTVSFVYNESWNKELLFDRNLEFDEASGRFIRPDPNFRRIRQYSFEGVADYYGLVLEAKHRSSRFNLGGNVTFAHATDQGDNFNVQVNDVRFPELEIGPQKDTPTVRGVLYGTYQFNQNHVASFIYRGRTGFRIDPRAGGTFDLNRDGNFGDRTPGFTRNEFTGEGSHTVNARYTFQLPVDRGRFEVTVEAFNLLNRDNPLDFNEIYGPDPNNPLPTFGRPIAFSNPREIQIGVRFAF